MPDVLGSDFANASLARRRGDQGVVGARADQAALPEFAEQREVVGSGQGDDRREPAYQVAEQRRRSGGGRSLTARHGDVCFHERVCCEHPSPTEAEIREGLSGNLCRCTGYQNIVKAVQQAAGAGRMGSG